MNKDIETIGAKPTGLKGKIAGHVMNIIHSALYKKIIAKYIIHSTKISPKLTVLDIGCGGGIAIKIFSSHPSIQKVCGIDYSVDMVKLSMKLNKREIENETVEIVKADILKIPYKNDFFDIITCFDTINFWTDHNEALNEIKRVLKRNDRVYIINAYPKEGTKWHNFVKFKNNGEYERLFTNNGFIKIISEFEKNTIIVSGYKS